LDAEFEWQFARKSVKMGCLRKNVSKTIQLTIIFFSLERVIQYFVQECVVRSYILMNASVEATQKASFFSFLCF